MVRRIAARIAGDDDMIPGLQCLAGDILLAQEGPTAPLHGPPLSVPVGILNAYLNERMRILEQERDQVPFDRHGVVDEISRGKGVMGVNRNAGYDRPDNERNEQCAVLSISPNYPLRSRYTASINIFVVQGPWSAPYRPS